MRLGFLILLLSAMAACGSSYRNPDVPLVAKADFEPERYLGLWYEVARFPARFQDGCTATTAQYGSIDAGSVSVVNTCRQGSPSGPIEQISGRAELVGPGQLEVRFDYLPFVRGDYVVLWVDEGYHTAVVGTRSGRAGWILARTTEIAPETRRSAEVVLQSNGYDTSALIDMAHQ